MDRWYYGSDDRPVTNSLNAKLNHWLKHGKGSLTFKGVTYVFPARLLEDDQFIDDDGRSFNDSYYHVNIASGGFIWRDDHEELLTDELDHVDDQLPPPINYVGFTQIESANIYRWLFGDEDCHDIRIRGNLILRYNPDDPYQLMTKYVSFGEGKDVPVMGHSAGSFVRWYDNANRLQNTQKCQELENEPKRIFDGRVRNGPYYRDAELPNLKDVPIGDDRMSLWQWQIGKNLQGTFDIKSSRRISAWLKDGKDDVVSVDIVLHYPADGASAHSFSISGPGNEIGIAFEVESHKAGPLVSYDKTAAWISTKTAKPFIGYQRFNEWIESGIGDIAFPMYNSSIRLESLLTVNTVLWLQKRLMVVGVFTRIYRYHV